MKLGVSRESEIFIGELISDLSGDDGKDTGLESPDAVLAASSFWETFSGNSGASEVIANRFS